MHAERILSALPSVAEAAAAQELLRAFLPVTRLVAAQRLAVRAPLWLKLEAELPTGSFKVRGAWYALQQRRAHAGVSEVVAASTGNHGAAVAYAARAARVPATIFLPERPNPTKRARILEHGARVVEVSGDLAAARAAAEAHAAQQHAWLLDDATDPDVPAGAATIGLELLEQRPSATTWFVPMGDTALIRGVASVAKAAGSGIRVVGVQAANAPSYQRSWRAGHAVETATCDTIADGLATRVPHEDNVAAIRQVVDDVVLVTDEQLIDTMRLLLTHEEILAEPAGAAAVCAALSVPARGGDAVALVTGCNATAHVLARLLATGSPIDPA